MLIFVTSRSYLLSKNDFTSSTLFKEPSVLNTEEPDRSNLFPFFAPVATNKSEGVVAVFVRLLTAIDSA